MKNNRSVQRLNVMLLLIVLLSGFTTQTPAAAPEPVTLKLNWRHGVQFLGFYAAEASGYYADEGFVVRIEPLVESTDANEVPGRIVAGEYDFGVGGRAMEQAQANGVPVSTIASVFQYNPAALFARADSGIVTPADLAGRRVVIKSSNWRKFIETLLEHEGLTLADIEEVSGGFDMTPFLKGEVDVWAGYITDEVVRARHQGLELVTFPLYEYGIYTNALTLYVSRKALADNPDRAVRFLRASLRGWEWAVEHPAEAVDIMLQRFPEMTAERDFHLDSFIVSIPLIHPHGIRIGAIDCAKNWQAQELFSELESVEGLCTTSILDAVWEKE